MSIMVVGTQSSLLYQRHFPQLISLRPSRLEGGNEDNTYKSILGAISNNRGLRIENEQNARISQSRIYR